MYTYYIIACVHAHTCVHMCAHTHVCVSTCVRVCVKFPGKNTLIDVRGTRAPRIIRNVAKKKKKREKDSERIERAFPH